MKANKEEIKFTCLAVEQSGDIVCAGSEDPYNIFLWSLKTGQLIDVLGGHEAPISSIQFNPSNGNLVSSSWDQTARVWDVFGKNGLMETFEHPSEVLNVQFHPNSNDLISTTLSGQIYVWDQEASTVKAILDCKDDIKGGRMRDDRQSAKNSTKNKHFNSISVSPNGQFTLGGGNSKNLCLYDTKSKVLLRRFAIT
mmetsp:Transcript_20948/g.32449  ORF Transcript_20948/g.32449 Transcript_20948/m.32449 type:complete len:196 (+) Transcript_20948:1391-1978(+)